MASRFAIQVVVTAALLSLLFSCGVEGKEKIKYIELVQHEDELPGPGATTVLIVSPPGANFSSFGTLNAFNNRCTKTADPNSELLATQLGTLLISDVYFYLSFIYVFNTTELQGTLTVQGQIIQGVFPREWAITGGSGDFRFAHGYDYSIAIDPYLGHFVTRHELHLEYSR